MKALIRPCKTETQFAKIHAFELKVRRQKTADDPQPGVGLCEVCRDLRLQFGDSLKMRAVLVSFWTHDSRQNWCRVEVGSNGKHRD